jgi:hypothetical protein
MDHGNLCPICGYDLRQPAWVDDSPSDEICPSCGIQFGYADVKSRREGTEDAFYHGWRACWLTHGAHWSSKVRTAPIGWSGKEQVARLLGQD